MSNRLDDFLKKQCMSRDWLAREIGVSVNSVTRYINGDRVPSKDVMRKIYSVTNGYVRPDHFYDLPRLNRVAMTYTPRRDQMQAIEVPLPFDVPTQNAGVQT